MKLTDAKVKIIEGQLVIEGCQIKGLFADAAKEPNICKHAESSASLPVEDLMPGHVFPATVYTTSRAS